MPGFLSHYIAAQETLKILSPDITKKIQPSDRLYNLGAQGPDIFFYCVPGIIRRRSRGIAAEMHQSDLGLFIARMAFIAKNSQGKLRKSKQDTIFAYTAGLVMHYVLDVHAHPYVYSQVHDERASKLKNSANHRRFETAVDTALLHEVMSKKPAEYHQWQLIAAKPTQLFVAATAASKALWQVYARQIHPHEVYQAMRHMIGITRILRSRKGRRKKWMELAESITVGQPILSSMVHNQIETGEDYLNHGRCEWKAPWDGSVAQFTSFMMLYEKAVIEGCDIINALYKYVYEEGKLRTLVEKVGNRSLKTGMPVGGIK